MTIASPVFDHGGGALRKADVAMVEDGLDSHALPHGGIGQYGAAVDALDCSLPFQRCEVLTDGHLGDVQPLRRLADGKSPAFAHCVQQRPASLIRQHRSPRCLSSSECGVE